VKRVDCWGFKCRRVLNTEEQRGTEEEKSRGRKEQRKKRAEEEKSRGRKEQRKKRAEEDKERRKRAGAV
jgi:hypothetical protein